MTEQVDPNRIRDWIRIARTDWERTRRNLMEKDRPCHILKEGYNEPKKRT